MRTVLAAVFVLAILDLSGCGAGSTSNPVNPNPPPPPPIMGAMTTVDFGTVHQTIRGFGGADAWMPVMPSAEVNALFGTGAGQIGLSILRMRIDPVSSTNWSTELANAQDAIAAGSNVSVIATPWTPPAAMKSNNDIANGGSLNAGSY